MNKEGQQARVDAKGNVIALDLRKMSTLPLPKEFASALWRKGHSWCVTNGTNLGCESDWKKLMMKLLRRCKICPDGTSRGTLTWDLRKNPQSNWPVELSLTTVQTNLGAAIADHDKRLVWKIIWSVRARHARAQDDASTSARDNISSDITTTQEVVVCRRISPIGPGYVLSDLKIIFPGLRMNLASTRSFVATLHLPHALVVYLTDPFQISLNEPWTVPLVGSRGCMPCITCFGIKCDPLCKQCDGLGYIFESEVFMPFLFVNGPLMVDTGGSFTPGDVERAFTAPFGFTQPNEELCTGPHQATSFHVNLVNAPGTSSLGLGHKRAKSDTVTPNEPRPVKRTKKQDTKISAEMLLRQTGFYGTGCNTGPSLPLSPPFFRELAGIIANLYEAPWYSNAKIFAAQQVAANTIVIRFGGRYAFMCPRHTAECPGLVIRHRTPSVFFVFSADETKVRSVCLDPSCRSTQSKYRIRTMCVDVTRKIFQAAHQAGYGT